MKRFLIFLSVSLFCSVSHAQVQPTLSLDFENSADGNGVNGQIIAAKVEGKLEFQDGKFGKALKSGPSSGYLHFPTMGVLRPEEGTVEMWISPLDWEGTEKKFHVFFDVRGQGAIYLYKFFSGGLLLLTAPDAAGPFRNAMQTIENWKPGQWHHIAGTWNETQQHLYIDGKLVASVEPSPPRTLNAEFMIGDHPWTEDIGGPRTSSSLIDNVRIYDRALSPAHIAAHFAGDYQKVVPLSSETLQLFVVVNPITQEISALVDSGGADVEAGQAVELAVLQGEKVLRQKTVTFAGSLLKTEFTLENAAIGDYQLRATIAGANAAPLAVSKNFRLLEKPVFDTSWKGNTIGLSKKVPPPWTPLKVTRNGAKFSVACWGREYQFGAAPLPTQIVALNENLLAAPMALKMISDGKEILWKNGSAKIVAQSDYAVDIEGSAQAAAVPGVLLTTKLHLEYDGLMTVEFNLQAPENFQPQNVFIEMPVRQQNAMYRHRWTSQWEGFSGNVPSGNGVVETQNFTPFGWLGDNDRGLFWFCETGQFWPHHQSDNAYETVRSEINKAGAVTMRLNLIQGEKMPQNWNYQFGIQATPVKSVPRNWRKHRIAPVPMEDVRPTVEILWPSGLPYSHKWFGYPEAANEEALRAHLKESRAAGMTTIPYTTMTQMWAETPEWLFFNRDWNNLRPNEKTGAEGVNYTPKFEWVLPTNKDYSDWMAWKHLDFMKKFNFDGYYFDQVHPYQTTRKEGGAWQDKNGAWQPVYPILAFRDLYRRLYVAVKEANPDAFILHHMSGKIGIPYLAYTDATLDGEHFRGQFKNEKNDSYFDVLPLDAFRAGYMGKQWGVGSYFLPALFAEDGEPKAMQGDEPARGLASLLLVHDVSPWIIWANPKPFVEAFDALDSFGYVDSEFIPYFDKNPPATTDMKDVYVSVYKRQDGRALAIVANLSEEAKSGTVTLNAKRIGLSTSGVLLWPDKTLAPRDGEKIKISLAKQGFQMLLIGKVPKEK